MGGLPFGYSSRNFPRLLFISLFKRFIDLGLGVGLGLGMGLGLVLGLGLAIGLGWARFHNLHVTVRISSN